MKCPSCGHENEGGSKFCQSCGANMEAASAPGVTATPPPPPPPPPPAQPRPAAPPPPRGGTGNIDMGEIVSKSFNEVFSNIGGYVLLALAITLVGGITMGILMGPLMGGMFYVIRRKLRGQGELDIGMAFNKGFEKFAPTFLFALIVAVAYGIIIFILMITVIGMVAFIIVIPALIAIVAIGLQLIMEENMEFGAALSEAFNILKSQFWMLILTCLVLGLVSGLGTIACGIGVLVTMPIAYVGMVKMMNALRYGD